MKTQKRRRRENKTDYKLRLSLLKSKYPRLVIRKTNKYIIIQLVESEEAKDKVINGITSKELLNYIDKKYIGSLKSLPAAYLTGILFANKIPKKEYIIDQGLARKIYGSRIYAAVKGLIDGGLKINANEKIFPSKERLEGVHLKKEVAQVFLNAKKELMKAK